jgi:hypothetical protein
MARDMSITNSELRKKPGTAASIAKYPFTVSPFPYRPDLSRPGPDVYGDVTGPDAGEEASEKQRAILP